MSVPRLRMFAGPNGSGKNTIKNVVSPELLGVYLNPGKIEKDIGQRGFQDVRDHGVETTPEDKIVTRYGRSLDLVIAAIRHTNRTYLFDNSREGGGRLWAAEITGGRELDLKQASNRLPKDYNL